MILVTWDTLEPTALFAMSASIQSTVPAHLVLSSVLTVLPAWTLLVARSAQLAILATSATTASKDTTLHQLRPSPALSAPQPSPTAISA